MSCAPSRAARTRTAPTRCARGNHTALTFTLTSAPAWQLALALNLVAACSEPTASVPAWIDPLVVNRLQQDGHARLMLKLRPGWTPRRGLGRVQYRSRNAAAVSVESRELDELARDPRLLRIELEASGHGHLAQSLPLAGITAAHTLGAQGQGVDVVVIDSGVDATHPDLAGQVADEACFCSTGCCPGGADSAFGPGSARDDNGHGTHVAASIASAGSVGPRGGAPLSKVIAIKVLDANNQLCCTSDVLAALDWLSAMHPDARVVNMSFGFNTLHAGDCDRADANTAALADAVDALHARGVMVLASSGNQGSSFSMAAPACIRSVVSIGATWDAALGPQLNHGCSTPDTQPDTIACFSNASATTDLVAPGALITASWPGSTTLTRAGTSEASAIAAACVADLWSSAPQRSADELWMALRSTGKPVVDPRNDLTYPRIDCGAALESLRAMTAMDSGMDAQASDAAVSDAAVSDAVVSDAGSGPEAGLDSGSGETPSDAALPDAAGEPVDSPADADAAGQADTQPWPGGRGAQSAAGASAGSQAPNDAGHEGDASSRQPHLTHARRVRDAIPTCDAVAQPAPSGGLIWRLAGTLALLASGWGKRRRRVAARPK